MRLQLGGFDLTDGNDQHHQSESDWNCLHVSQHAQCSWDSFSEALIRTAFQCLQLVVTDFLPTMPCTCLQIVVEVAGSFGLQNQELNISLTSIGLLVRREHLFTYSCFHLTRWEASVMEGKYLNSQSNGSATSSQNIGNKVTKI